LDWELELGFELHMDLDVELVWIRIKIGYGFGISLELHMDLDMELEWIGIGHEFEIGLDYNWILFPRDLVVLKAFYCETKYNFLCHCWSFGCLMTICLNNFLFNLFPSIFACSPFSNNK
jgi:hypothetical protein